MKREDPNSDPAQGDQLDRLIRIYLEGSDEGRPPDPEDLVRHHPQLRTEFFQFLQDHRRLRDNLSPASSPRLDVVQPADYQPTHSLLDNEGLTNHDGSTIAAARGDKLGDCEILDELGRGGMGVVYFARHVRVNDLRAVKILPRERVKDESIRRFWQEAQAAGSIRHPNVISVHDVGQQASLHFIVMQYIAGKTLGEVLAARDRPLSWRTAVRLIVPILDALTAIHDRGLVHRDIKPSNIMVTRASSVLRKQHVVLMDFGLVHHRTTADANLTSSGAILGTPAYMSREQALGLSVDCRTDLYAIGATLYFLLTGHAPYHGTATEVYLQAAAGVKPESLSKIRPELPSLLCQTVDTAMDPDIDQRHPSATDMLRPLASLLRSIPTPPPTREATELGTERDLEGIPATPTWNPQVKHDTATLDEDTDERNLISPGPISKITPARSAPDVRPVGRELTIDRPGEKRPSVRLQQRCKRWARRLLAARWSPTIVVASIVGLTIASIINLSAILLTDGEVAATEPRTSQTAGMVRIPTGTVQLGGSEDQLRNHAESLESIKDSPRAIQRFVRLCQEEPFETVSVASFWIDRFEVTNAQYAEFVNSTNHPPPEYWNGANPPAGEDSHPVRQIRHADATAYAQWAGKQLPTVAQWTRAFRGSDGRMYPWGNQWDDERANVAQNEAFASGTTSVDASPRDVSPFGVFNLVGNVSEFMREKRDLHGEPVVLTKGAEANSMGDIYGAAPIIYFLGVDEPYDMTGFRCVLEERE